MVLVINLYLTVPQMVEGLTLDLRLGLHIKLTTPRLILLDTERRHLVLVAIQDLVQLQGLHFVQLLDLVHLQGLEEVQV